MKRFVSRNQEEIEIILIMMVTLLVGALAVFGTDHLERLFR